MNEDTSIPLYVPTSFDAPRLFSRTPGPNLWSSVQPSDFGPQHDYELENHITKWIITPISEAALQWLYCHLPEHCPRYGAKGFIVEAEYVNLVVKGMTRDKLMSPDEYEAAMNEAHILRLQGETR